MRFSASPFCRCSRFMIFGATSLIWLFYILFIRIRLCFADFFKYRLCGLSLCIQQDSFLFNFVFSCRFCLSAFHSSNSRIPSSLLKKSMIAGINARASESISYCGIPVVFFLLAIPRCYVICSIAFLLVFGYSVLLSAAVVAAALWFERIRRGFLLSWFMQQRIKLVGIGVEHIAYHSERRVLCLVHALSLL